MVSGVFVDDLVLDLYDGTSDVSTDLAIREDHAPAAASELTRALTPTTRGRARLRADMYGRFTLAANTRNALDGPPRTSPRAAALRRPPRIRCPRAGLAER